MCRPKPVVSVGLTPMGDGERIKLTIAPLTERPRSAGEPSPPVRALIQSESTTPERPARLLLDIDSAPSQSAVPSPSLPPKVRPKRRNLCFVCFPRFYTCPGSCDHPSS